MNTIPLIILIFLLPIGLGGFLLIRGFRGYRIGDHPVCRRCAFDLFGQPAGTVVCGECGSDLTRPSAVAIGHRRRQGSFIIAGFTILLPVLLVAVAFLWGSIDFINWLDYAPTRLVLRLAGSSNPATRSSAFAELNARLTAGTLDDRDLAKIADRGLAFQADATKPWDSAWGDWIENAQAAGKLSEARWKLYLMQAWQGSFAFKLRPRVRRGDPVPYVLATGPTRAANNSKLMTEIKGLELAWLSSHGPVTLRGGLGGMGTALGSVGGSTCGSCLNFSDLPHEMTDGVQQLEYHGTVDVGYPNPQMWNVIPITTGQFKLTGSFTLLPANQPTGKLTDNPGLADAIQKSLSAQIYASSWPGFQLNVNGPPIGISFDVFVRSDGQEIKAGTVACPAGTTLQGFGMDAKGLSAKPKMVDIILRSNIDPLLNTLDTFEGWKGEIVLKDLPVK